MKKYYFPLNYQYAPKFLGIIEYRILVPLSIYASIIFFILYAIRLDFFWSTGVFIVLVIPPTILFSVGIHKEPIIPFLISVHRFKKNARVYVYSPKKK